MFTGHLKAAAGAGAVHILWLFAVLCLSHIVAVAVRCVYANSADTSVNYLQVEVTRAVGPSSGMAGVAEAPAGIGDALAAAREDHRSRRMLVQRSDSARMGPLEVFPEVA